MKIYIVRPTYFKLRFKEMKREKGIEGCLCYFHIRGLWFHTIEKKDIWELLYVCISCTIIYVSTSYKNILNLSALIISKTKN